MKAGAAKQKHGPSRASFRADLGASAAEQKRGQNTDGEYSSTGKRQSNKLKTGKASDMSALRARSLSPLSPLQKVYQVFVDYLDPDPVLDQLLKIGFHQTTIRDIREERLTSDKNRKLIEAVQKRGDKAYCNFKSSLRQCGQELLYNLLDRTERGENTLDLQQEFREKAQTKPESEDNKLYKDEINNGIREDSASNAERGSWHWSLTDLHATRKGLHLEKSLQLQNTQVAAIDYGTTYSGYAFSFRKDFEVDPLKIYTSNLIEPYLKIPSCILFDPSENFHSFGYEAEDTYAELAAREMQFDWFYFKRFKMMLYEHKKLRRDVTLEDDKGLKMSAMKVFSESIRYLKNHLIQTCKKKVIDLKIDEVHWVLTVPAIWDDSAKDIMREAAIEAGIMTKHLSLALEPEAASLFCSYRPVEKLQGDSGGQDFRLVPGKRHLVLDAGGSTVDITVHETLADGTMGVLYKANASPWGSTKVDDAFLKFLDDVYGEDTIHTFMVNFNEDYLHLLRDFEIKKKSFGAELQAGQEVIFRIPHHFIHETYQKIYGHDFMTSFMMKQDLKDQIRFIGDKLRVQPEQVEKLFEQTCNKIVDHLKDIFSKPEVTGTDTILMVGGFSESVMLQRFIKDNFPNKKILIPEDAGLAVLKGAVISGHYLIENRVAKRTYGVETTREFIPGIHPESKKKIYDGVARCTGLFDIHVTEGQEIPVGQDVTRTYFPITRSQKSLDLSLYTSTKRDPVYTDENECFYLGKVRIDISNIQKVSERDILVKMNYGGSEIGVEARVVKTGVVLDAYIDFLG